MSADNTEWQSAPVALPPGEEVISAGVGHNEYWVATRVTREPGRIKISTVRTNHQKQCWDLELRLVLQETPASK